MSHALRRVLPAAVAVAALHALPAGAATPPSIRAPQAILVQPETGDVIYRRNASARRPIASTTKLMTALLAVEHLKLNATLTAGPYTPSPAESLINLRQGERMKVSDMLRGLLLASANDVASTLALRIAGSRAAFVALMNKRAREIGLRNTHYTNPIGLDSPPGNYSSAEDLVKLALVLLRNRFVAETVSMPAATLRTGDHVRRIVNRDTLVGRVPYVVGVKTGHTSIAGYVLVGAAKRDGVRVLSAVLGDPSEAARNADTAALLRFGLGRYRVLTPLKAGTVLARPEVRYQDEHADLVASKSFSLVARRDERAYVRVTGAPSRLTGPVRRGTREGTVLVRFRGRVVARIALVTRSSIPEATLTERVGSYFSGLWVAIGLAVLLVCSLQLALLRRRATLRRRARAKAREERGTLGA